MCQFFFRVGPILARRRTSSTKQYSESGLRVRLCKTMAKLPILQLGIPDSWTVKVVLGGSPRCPDNHDLSKCHHLYDLGRHIEQP